MARSMYDDQPVFEQVLRCRVYVHGRQVLESWIGASEAPEAAVAALRARAPQWTEEHADEGRVVVYTAS